MFAKVLLVGFSMFFKIAKPLINGFKNNRKHRKPINGFYILPFVLWLALPEL